VNAISFKGPSILLAPNAIDTPAEDATEEQLRTHERVQKNQRRRVGVARTVLAAVLALTLVGSLVYFNLIDQTPAPDVGIEVGNTCPDITIALVGEEAEHFTLSENRGKITVLNFWYTTCGPCVEELPHFNALANEKSQSVTVVAIHLDQAWVDLPTWIDTAHPEWGEESEMLIAWDTDHVTETLFGVQACPVTVIVDEDGVITFLRVGSVSEETLYEEVEKAIID
jgi:thiol-disulfide isomerase/thioredoxin